MMVVVVARRLPLIATVLSFSFVVSNNGTTTGSIDVIASKH